MELLSQGKAYEEAREIIKGEVLESVQIIKVIDRPPPFVEWTGRISDCDFSMMRMLIDVVVRNREMKIPFDSLFQGIFH